MMAKDGLFCRIVFFGLIIANTAGAQVWTEYLGGKDVKTIVWDSERKLIWFATYGSGVIAFDGANFVEYNTISTNRELVSDTLTCAAIDYDFDLWFGTEDQGLIRFEPDSSRWQTYTTKHGLLPGRINTLAVDVQNGSIWIGTGLGVNNFDRYSRWDTLDTNRGLSSNDVYSIATDHQGNKWFGTNQAGVSQRDSSGDWFYYLKNERRIIYSVFVDTLGGDLSLYFGTEDGVYRLFPKTGQFDERIRKNSPLAGRSVESIIADENGYKWFGYSFGAARLDLAEPDSIWKLFNDATTLNSRKIVTMARDGDDNLWFGSDYLQQGAVKVTSNWLTFNERDGLASNAALALAKDKNDTIWAGTSNGLSKLRNTYWESFISYFSIPITTIAIDTANGMWLGTSGYGAYYIPPNVSPDDFTQVKYYPESNTNQGPVSKFVNAIVLSGQGVWMATAAGLSHFQPETEKWESFRHENGRLINNQVNAVAVDGDIVWCGTVAGVSRFDTKAKTWQSFTKDDGLAGNWVTAILIEDKNKIWFASKSGASFYNNGVWEKTLTISDGLADNNVNVLLPAENPKGIWFGTTNGASFRDSAGVWTTVRRPEGLGGDHVVALLQDNNDHIWFGSSLQGVTRYKRKRNPPAVELHSRFDIISSAQIVYEFNGKDIGTPENLLRYAYRLDGEEYSSWTSDRSARLLIRRDGLHTFHVKAIDTDGIQSAEATDTFYKISLGTGRSTSFTYSNSGRNLASLVIKLFWPPNLFAEDPQITIQPDTSASLEHSTLFAFDLVSEDRSLDAFKKRVTLTFALPRFDSNKAARLKIFRGAEKPQPQWELIGGTITTRADTVFISTAIESLGRYALREAGNESVVAPSAVSAQPRIFSPLGGGHGRETTLSFYLNGVSNVRVRVYNLAGRLIDTIWDDQMQPGINAVTWNGRDSNGHVCPTGLYVLTVESSVLNDTKKVMVLNETRP